VSYHNRLTANYFHLKIMKNKPKLKDGKLDWSDVPPEIQQAIQYLEYRRLRHKHPHC